MFLVITNPFGDKQEQAIDTQGLPLGAVIPKEYQSSIGGVLINGRFHDDWQSFVGRQGDRAEFILKTADWGISAIISAVIASAVSAAISAIVRALTPQPKKPKQTRRQEAFGIAGFNNTTGAGIPKFVVFGENRVHGHVIGSSVTVSEDGREMLGHMLYLMGDTGLDGYESISDVTIDETDVSQFGDIQIETRLGTAGQTIIPKFQDASAVYSDNRALEFDRGSQTGTPIIYTTKTNVVNQVRLFYLFTSGLFRVNAKGKERGAGVGIRIEYKKNSDPDFILYGEFEFAEQMVSPGFKGNQLEFPSQDKWDVKLTKIYEAGFVSGEPFFGDVSLFNVEEITYTNLNYPGSALLAVLNISARKIRSFEGMRVSALVKGQKCKVWDGNNYVTEYTRKRCWIVRTMLTHDLIGMGNEIDESEIDDNQWLEAQNYYDELVTGHNGNEVRDLCDFIMNESQWDWEWIKGVAGEGRGRVIPSGDKWKYLIDKPGSPELLYAEPGNIIDGSLIAEIAQDDRPFNQVIGEFRDMTNDYKPDIAPPITDPDIGSDPIVQESRRYDTIIRESEIQRENTIIIKREKLERRKFMFTSPRGAIVSEPLSIDYLAERTIGNEGAYAGFLPAGSTMSNVILPFPCELKPAETYAIIIRHKSDNTVEYRTVNTASGTWAQVSVSSAFTEAPVEGDLFALGIENVDHILTRAQELIIDNEGRVRQLRTEYIPAVYTADPLPDKQARRFFRLGDQPPPIPLHDAVVREEIVLNRDGSIRSMLVFDVTPGLPKHAGTAQGGDTNAITLATFEPQIDDYYNTAIIRIIGGTGTGQERKVSDYNGATRQVFPDSSFSPAPDVTSLYEIEWTRYGEFGGFRVETRDDATMNFVEIARASGIHWEMDGRGSGPGIEEFRFTPFSIAGVDNPNGRLIRSLSLIGDLSAPAAPASIVLTAYLKTVGATVTLNRPVAEDFSAVEIEFWRDSIGSGTLLKTARYGSAPDNATSGTMTIEASATFGDESYGAAIFARGRSVDRSNNASAFVDASNAVTLTLPPDFGPDTIAPAVPTGLVLTTGVQPDPVTGLPQVFLQGSWDANTEADISVYEFQYRRQGSAAWTVRMISHPEVSSRDIGVVGNALHEARVQAIDTAGNKSGFSGIVSIVTAKDTTPPAPPTDLSVINGFQQTLIRFSPPPDVDFSTVEIWRSQTDDIGTAVYVGDSTKGAISYTDQNLPNDTTFFYWARSKDFSGNVSTFAGSVTATTLRIGPGDVVTTNLVTQSAQIANAIINNAHISNLSADKLTAGTLQAFYQLGVGAGISLDGPNRQIYVIDAQPRPRVVLGRVGPNSSDYGLQIFGADGSIWMSITEGLYTLGIAPHAVTQLATFWDGNGTTFGGGAGGWWMVGIIALVTTGGAVWLNARSYVQNSDISTASHHLQIWRDQLPFSGVLVDALAYAVPPGDDETVQLIAVDQPVAGYHEWYLIDYDASGQGVNPTHWNRKLQGLETKR